MVKGELLSDNHNNFFNFKQDVKDINWPPKILDEPSCVQPEKKLMMAILKDAIYCYTKYLVPRNVKEKEIFDNAEEWLFEKNEKWVFSFINICDTLGFDPDYFRQMLIILKKSILNKKRKKK